MLGGFSQGGMLAAEVAFRTEQPLEALILLSPTFVDEQRWIEGMPRRKGLPVFISHGRRDDVLPFAASERLAQAMRQAGIEGDVGAVRRRPRNAGERRHGAEQVPGERRAAVAGLSGRRARAIQRELSSARS